MKLTKLEYALIGTCLVLIAALATWAHEPPPQTIVCDNAEWTESTDPEAQGGDREQMCSINSYHGPRMIRVVDLD